MDHRLLSPALSLFFFFQSYLHPPDLHSFPTRRSSDLISHWLALSSKTDSLTIVMQFSTGQTASRTASRSEEHTSELQSLRHLVCRLLLEKKKKKKKTISNTITTTRTKSRFRPYTERLY